MLVICVCEKKQSVWESDFLTKIEDLTTIPEDLNKTKRLSKTWCGPSLFLFTSTSPPTADGAVCSTCNQVHHRIRLQYTKQQPEAVVFTILFFIMVSSPLCLGFVRLINVYLVFFVCCHSSNRHRRKRKKH